MVVESITLAIAFAGGLLSFFSPCTLPLLPSLIAFFEEEETEAKGRINIRKCLAFWCGFTVVFLVMGSIASFLGALFFEYRGWLVKISGIFVVCMGIFLLGLGGRSVLQREYRPFLAGRFQGYLGAFLFGMAFTVGWTPCSGPILAAILTVAGNSEQPTAGLALLSAYAAGFGIPFGVLMIFFNQLFRRIRGINQFLPWIQKMTGVLLILLGILIYLDKLGKWILRLAA